MESNEVGTERHEGGDKNPRDLYFDSRDVKLVVPRRLEKLNGERHTFGGEIERDVERLMGNEIDQSSERLGVSNRLLVRLRFEQRLRCRRE